MNKEFEEWEYKKTKGTVAFVGLFAVILITLLEG